MKYGKYEYERLFLLNNNCLNNIKIERIKKLKDKYIKDTKLRLRKVEENSKTVYKLTQKEKLKCPKKGILRINTIYLTKIEFDKLNTLEGFEVEKERYIHLSNQIRIGIDRIIFNKNKLLIAEVEFESELEMNTFSMPLDFIKEITGEQKYSGYEIAKEYSECY